VLLLEDRNMSTRESYTSEEWAIVSALPSQAAIAAAVSDGVSLFGTIREFNEGLEAVEDGAEAHAGNELIAAILTDMADQAEITADAERMVAEGGTPPPAEEDLVDELPMTAAEPDTEATAEVAEEVFASSSVTDMVTAFEAPEVDPRDPAAFVHEVVANAAQAKEILAAKSAPDEINGYVAWVLEIVDRVINRSKSGGFLGIGGKRVDEEEAEFRAELAAALGQ
jgi:hypothetical protein